MGKSCNNCKHCQDLICKFTWKEVDSDFLCKKWKKKIPKYVAIRQKGDAVE